MTDDIRTIHEGVMKFIHEAALLLDDQPLTNMEAVQSEVAKLCERINQLPLERRVQYAKEMGELSEALQKLETKLLSKRDEIKDEMQTGNAHGRASKAYVTADHRDKPGNDN